MPPRSAREADSDFVRHEPCPSCGSRDNLARYSDGHAYCFGCDHYEPGDGEVPQRTDEPRRRMDLIFDAEITSIPNRGLTADTCEKFNYRVGTWKGGRAHFATYYDATGRPVAADATTDRPSSRRT